MELVYLILVGFISGVFGGMGMGGGTLLIPLLTIFLGVGQISAQGVNLIAFLPMSLIAIAIHLKNHLISTKNILFIIIPGVLFSIGGALLATIIPQNVISIIFAFFLIIVAIFQFVVFFKDLKQKN